MIYLTTGANGTGKTLLTLRDVRERQLKDVRPVAYNGRFDLTRDDFGWKKIDAKDWQQEPDGTIFLFDECHNDFPAAGSKDVPPYIMALAEHRRRGFDFYMITQHPMMLHANVRRIIGDPGYHRHLKRAAGAPLVSVSKWPSVKDQPQKHGSSADAGSVSMVPYPREVYGWYNSASLHTAKVAIPWKVKAGALGLVAAVVLGVLGFRSLQKSTHTDSESVAASQGAKAPEKAASGPSRPQGEPGRRQLTGPEYVASFKPRVDGLAYTAPRYDEVTKPTLAPFPSACVQMGDRCDCYSQQATKMQVGKELCIQIVKNGYFQDWGQPRTQDAPRQVASVTPDPLQQVAQSPVIVAQAPQPAPAPAPAPQPPRPALKPSPARH